MDAATASTLLKQGVCGSDVIARQKRLHVAGMNGFNANFQMLPPAENQMISRQVYAMKPGEVKTIRRRARISGPQGQQVACRRYPAAFGRSNRRSPARPSCKRPPQRRRNWRKLYQNAKIEFEVDKYATYFADVQNMPVPSDTGKKTASIK